MYARSRIADRFPSIDRKDDMRDRIFAELIVLSVLILAVVLLYPRISAWTVRAQMKEQEKMNNLRLFGRRDVD